MKKSILAIILITIMIAAMLSGCAQKERVVRVNVTYSGFDGFIGVLIKEKGLLEKHVPDDVTIEWSGITSGTEMRDGIISGNLDMAALSVLSIATALQQGFPIVYIAYNGSGLFQLYSNDPAINSMDKLTSDMKISVSSIGTGPHSAFLVSALKDLGTTDAFDDSMITMTNMDAITALASGTEGVDAVVSTFPTLLTTWKLDNVYLVRDMSEEGIEYGIGSAQATNAEFAEKNPDVIEAYFKAYDEAIALLTTDREACIEVMMKAYENCDAETASFMLDYCIRAQDYSGEKYDKLMGFLYENGLLDEPAAKFADIPKFERE